MEPQYDYNTCTELIRLSCLKIVMGKNQKVSLEKFQLHHSHSFLDNYLLSSIPAIDLSTICQREK